MSTENVDIIVSEKGSQQASDNIRGVGNAADIANKQLQVMTGIMDRLRQVMAITGFAVSAKEIINLADTHSRLVNQIKQTVDSFEELTETYKKLFDMSQDTRTSFARNVDVFKELKESTRDFHTSTDQITSALKVMNQVMVADGGTAEDVGGALRMLSFGMSQGSIEGRALHAILLQFPDLGRLIASELGVTSKQLKEMGDNGQITTQKLIGVLSSTNAAAAASEAFAKVNLTVSGAFTVLSNAVIHYIGEIDTAQGASAALANGILFVAQHLSQIASIALEVAGAFAAMKLASWGASAATAFAGAVAGAARFGIALLGLQGPARALGALMTIATGGFNLLVAGIGAAIAWILQFGQAVKLTEDGSITLRGVVVGTFNYITDAIGRAYNAIVEWFQTSTLGQFLIDTLNAVATAISNVVDWAIKGLQALGLMGKDGSSEIDKLKASIVAASAPAKQMGGDFQEAGIKIMKGAATAEQAMNTLKQATDSSAGAIQNHANTTRNAMGQEIQVMDEWARRSGAYFNAVGQAATQSAADTVSAMQGMDSAAQSVSRSSSSASKAVTTGGVDFASSHILSSTHTGGTGFSSTPGFSGGGEFMVGGSGGTDSQLIQFMATPGEKVSVNTPGQQANNGKGSITVHAPITVYAQDAASFTKNQSQMAMQLQSKLTRAVRSIG